ncbi:MAG TPA: DUF983 domain-containing protein [Methylocystis sp.]|nr:DUF983 domain-containing protein [Methylocystis sp.]
MTAVDTQEQIRASAQAAAARVAPRLSRVLTSGFLGKCPACGEGSLFRAYLKRRDACPCCGESFQGLDADDGPAWLTIMIVGHVVVPLLYILETRAELSYPVEAAILIFVTIALVLYVLPFAKGLFISNLWWNERKPG